MSATAAAMGVLLAGSAQATVTTLTFTGVVTFDQDPLAIFGAANQTGQAYSLVFTTDDSLAGAHVSTPSPGVSEVKGATKGSFTLNGTTVDAPFGNAFARIDLSANKLSGLAGSPSVSFEAELDSFTHVLTTGDYKTSISTYTATSGDSGAADIGIFGPNFQNDILVLDVRTVTYSVASGDAGVPEPTAWMLMIVGFTGAGAALRRGRRAALA